MDVRNNAAIKLYKSIGFIKIKKLSKFHELMIFSLFKNSFVIGTVQFGKIYGITNFNNLIISKSEGKKIFNYCLKKDLNHLDNAEDYNFDLSLLPSKTDFLIDTKISIKNSSMNFISNNLVKKYRDYNIDTLYIHDPEYILSEKGKKIYEFLVNLKKKKEFQKLVSRFMTQKP